ncbi:hypothetical protein [Diaphorobacter caeni]|uniref:hypothetical protein n=1 Tax=Diaphorobacter caeni TaxID=2784387 RepID=UPI00189073A6|nr:hypothetical protein [Diaphorobacter caeni]MBF5007635.1 hypothetical protein [Diaphorobacter caeni]
MDHIQALRTIAEYPVAEQDDMPAANMRKIAIEALERLRSAEPAEPAEYPPLPARFHTVYDDIDGKTVPRFSADQMRAYVDADRAARAQAPAAVEPVADLIDWEMLPEDAGERNRFDRNLTLLHGGDARVAVTTALRLWAAAHSGRDFGLMCAIFANEVAKMHIAQASPADALDAKRYRWLRDVQIGDDPESINLPPAKRRGLDAAIDAAMAAQQDGGV